MDSGLSPSNCVLLLGDGVGTAAGRVGVHTVRLDVAAEARVGDLRGE